MTWAQFYSYYTTYNSHPDYKVYWYSKQPSIEWFRGFAPFMLAHYSHALFFYVRGEMVSKTTKRVNKLISIIAGILIVCFSSFAAVGYLSLGENMLPTMYTLRRPLSRSS